MQDGDSSTIDRLKEARHALYGLDDIVLIGRTYDQQYGEVVHDGIFPGFARSPIWRSKSIRSVMHIGVPVAPMYRVGGADRFCAPHSGRKAQRWMRQGQHPVSSTAG